MRGYAIPRSFYFLDMLNILEWKHSLANLYVGYVRFVVSVGGCGLCISGSWQTMPSEKGDEALDIAIVVMDKLCLHFNV